MVTSRAGVNKVMDPEIRRKKMAVTAYQMKHLLQWLWRQGLHDLARSFVIARHFALRYRSEALRIVPQGGEKGRVEFGKEAGLTTATIWCQRKPSGRALQAIKRPCACKRQHPMLCGVCVLRGLVAGRERSPKPIFASVGYPKALQTIKRAAGDLGWDHPNSWGTHIFRRGYARECFQYGGLAAMFLAGGWKSVAAFGYLESTQLSSMEACDFHVDFSDSEDEGE